MTAAARTFGWREALGILVCTSAGWAGFAAVGADAADALLLWFWYLPLPYFLAWFVTMLPRPASAAGALLVLGIGNAALVGLGLLIGSATLGLFALPAIVVCATLFGEVAAKVHARLDPTIEACRWKRVHARGCTAAGISLLVSFIIWVYARESASSWIIGAILIVTMTTGFGWHLLETARLARAHDMSLEPAGRRLAVLSLVLMFGAVTFVALRQP